MIMADTSEVLVTSPTNDNDPADSSKVVDMSVSKHNDEGPTDACNEKEVNILTGSNSLPKQPAEASPEKEVYNFDESSPLSNNEDGTFSSVSGFPNLYDGGDAPEVVANSSNLDGGNQQSTVHSAEKEATLNNSPSDNINTLLTSPGEQGPPQYSANAPDQGPAFAGCRSIQPDNREDIDRVSKRLAEAQNAMPMASTEWNSSFWACYSPLGLGKSSIA
jgi:hypothetical protein